MRRIQAARFDEALCALDLLLGWAGGWMPVRMRQGDAERMWWHRCSVPGSGELLTRAIRGVDERYSEEVLLGLPEPKRFHGGPMGATVLWARVEGKDQVDRARRFRPLPTLVLQEGSSSRRLLFWAVREQLPYFEVEDRNRKIAYRLRAVQRHGTPELLRVPAPGTCLRVGRSRPVPIVVGRLTTDVYAPDAVTGRLKTPPDIRWWEREGSA